MIIRTKEENLMAKKVNKYCKKCKLLDLCKKYWQYLNERNDFIRLSQ